MRQITMGLLVMVVLGLTTTAATAGDPYFDKLDRARDEARRDADKADKKKFNDAIDRRNDEAKKQAFAKDTEELFNLKTPNRKNNSAKPDMSRFDQLRAEAARKNSAVPRPTPAYGYRTAYAVYIARNGGGWIYYGAWYDPAAATQVINNRKAEGYSTCWMAYSAYGPVSK